MVANHQPRSGQHRPAAFASTAILRQQRLIFWGGMFVFGVATIALFLLSSTRPQLLVEYGLVVPDVFNMSQSLRVFALDDPPWLRVHELPGPWLLYGSLLAPDAPTCLVVNSLLIGASAVCWWRIAVRTLARPGWAVLAIIANPYLVLAMLGPNKEIPLLFLNLLLAWVVVQRPTLWLASSLLICAAVYPFRDGYAVVLGMWVVAVWWHRSRLATATAMLAVAACLAVLLATPLAEMFRFVGRQYRFADDPSRLPAFATWILGETGFDPTSAVVQPLLLVLRVVYNSTSQALFPVLLTDAGRLNFLGAAYFLNGLVVLIGFPIGIAVLKGRDGRCTWSVIAASALVSTIVLSSVSPQIQPRYFMPLWPMAYLVLLSVNRRLVIHATLGAIGLVALVMTVYALWGYPPARAAPFDGEAPAEVAEAR